MFSSNSKTYDSKQVSNEKQVCIAQIMQKNIIDVANIFRHGERMVVFNMLSFMMLHQDFKEL